MKQNYLVIPLIVIIIAIWGGLITSGGMVWYETIKLPAWTPSGVAIGIVWMVIFVLSAASALIIWNKKSKRDQKFWIIILIFILNALLNILWSNLFFGRGLIGLAAIEAVVMDLTVIALVALIWPLSKLASSLLLPYAGWVIFAIYLNYVIWILNR
ncbi:MAG: tryptophan-rich sensory protein [Patescibacteria group bacterium]|nr:tryptophan-rich sensory protein [Patescibacteria group bacterium]